MIHVLFLEPRQELDVSLLLGNGHVSIAGERGAGLGDDHGSPRRVGHRGRPAFGHPHVGRRVAEEPIDGRRELRSVGDLEALQQGEELDARRPQRGGGRGLLRRCRCARDGDVRERRAAEWYEPGMHWGHHFRTAFGHLNMRLDPALRQWIHQTAERVLSS